MYSVNSKLFLLAVSVAAFSTSAYAGGQSADDFDVALLLGPGSNFTLGASAQKNPNKNLDKEVKVPTYGGWLYFSNGKQVQSSQDPDGGKGKNFCKVMVQNTTARPQILVQRQMTLSNAPYMDSSDNKFEDFDLDQTKQVDKSGSPLPLIVSKVECSAPMVKNGRSNLTLHDMKNAFGKLASVHPYGGVTSPVATAPSNPTPVSNNGPVNGTKPPVDPTAPPVSTTPVSGGTVVGTAPAPAPAPADAGSLN
jgi:hypothetical protein